MAEPLFPVFLSTLLLSFACALLLAGLFGAYHGRGRSRATGFLLGIVALLLIALFAALTWDVVPGLPPRFDPDIVGMGLIAVLAALIGFVLAGATFVWAVVRS
ncbi:MAG TPA: hypothetical protein VFH47_02125 [Candidatus Thermoplasmatota archaeon]|nr:hypothetical protein [Candidatus Thermoplasmatota archaeon]